MFQVRSRASKTIHNQSQFCPKIHFLPFSNVAEIETHIQNASFYIPSLLKGAPREQTL